tara:strand:+ start:2 stop:2824 length:2823 start_codon:yes stop_codon:yes gene_type:complete
MRKRILQKLFLLIPLYLLSIGLSQSNQFYYHKNPDPIEEGYPIEISQLMFTQEEIVQGMLFFRNKGELSYQEIEMKFEEGKWIGFIPGHRVTEPGIEYVTILSTKYGGKISLPLIDKPFDNPLLISVVSNTSKQNGNIDQSRSVEFAEADILILSPEDGTINRPDEVVISLSLFNAPHIDQNNYRLFIGEVDYSDQTMISGDVLTLVPDNDLEFGFYKIKVIFQTTYGIEVEPIEWTFSVSKSMENISESFQYKGSLFGKESSTKVSSISIDEREYSGKIDAELSWIKARYSFRRSSRESKLAQPLNRNSLKLQITDYLMIEQGDVYPSISQYILDGKKVLGRQMKADIRYGFGFNGINFFGKNLFSFDLKGTIELHTVSGQLARAVQYQIGLDRAYDLIENDAKYDQNGNRIYRFDRKGYTFPRQINSARLAFSFNNRYKAGIHFLKSKDDFEKIDVRAPENSLFTVDTSIFGDTLTSQFNLAQFIDSLNNGDTIEIKKKNWSDGNPQENLVFGFDFEGSMDNRKLIFQMGWNMSLTNFNIWAGRAKKDSLDLLMDTIPDEKLLGTYPVSDIGNFIDTYQDIFTINPLYMAPILPIDPIVAEESTVRAFLNMPSSAYYLRFKGSYSFNNLLIEYRQLGPEYRSFGNPYLTNNMREFNINNRLSTLGRRLMFVLGYKYRDNKLSDLIAHPIATRTISLNTTLVPGPGAPSIILNLQSIGRTNGIDSIDTDQYGNYLGDNRENSQALNIMASINVPGNFDIFSTTTSININSISYKDNLGTERKPDYFFQKSETQSISATISTRFNFPLKTSSTLNQTKIFIPFLDENNIAKEERNIWTSFSNSMHYGLFGNKIRIHCGVDFTTNGKKDNTAIQLYGGKIGGDWDILDKLILSFSSSIRLNNNELYKSDNIDNDSDGKIDEGTENWSVNSSGFNLNLGYRF